MKNESPTSGVVSDTAHLGKELGLGIQVSRLFAALSLILFAAFRYPDPIWLLDTDLLIFAVLCATATLGGFFANSRGIRYGRSSSMLLLVNVAVVAAVLIVIAFIQHRFDFGISRIVMAYLPILALALLILNFLRIHRKTLLIVNLLVFATAVAPNLDPAVIGSFKEDVLGFSGIEFDESTAYVSSSLHDLKIQKIEIYADYRSTLGGGLSVVDRNRLLLGTGLGDFHLFTTEEAISHVGKIPLRVPINTDAYTRDVQYSQHFRVTDTFLADTNNRIRSLFAAHHYWHAEEQCVTLRLSEISIDTLTMSADKSGWKTRFDSWPCSRLKLTNENGGRIEFLPPKSLLLTIGTNDMDEVSEDLTDFDRSAHGKIVELDTENWTASIFSTGHRNPQGLLFADEEVWATEHGPHGGDELNRIERGRDYGWPRSTYGTSYGQKRWHRTTSSDVHEVGVKPTFAWTPSIGISNLIKVSGRAFPGWKGDFLIGSLIGLGNGRSLFRVRIVENRVVMAERIMTELPIRDIIETQDGSLVLWDGSQAIQHVTTSSHVFSQCSGCHALRWQSHGIGPDLLGIVGDRVANRDGFSYSKAMSDAGGTWTTSRLDDFLRDPSEFAPGTSMVFGGIADPALRAEIIEYLAEIKGDHQ
ncbi:MAG: PQQ-dependent sugar dehydrogenase [Pseudomonadota bacterium]